MKDRSVMTSSSRDHDHTADVALDDDNLPTVEQAEAALLQARALFAEVEAKRRVELRAAEEVINQSYASARGTASAAVGRAEAVLRAAKDRAPEHPWTGKRVYRMEPQGRSWHRLPEKRVEGVVETRRSNTLFPGNTGSYRLPMIGDGFVRLLKKDGTPGLQFDDLRRGFRAWELVEEEQASSAKPAERDSSRDEHLNTKAPND